MNLVSLALGIVSFSFILSVAAAGQKIDAEVARLNTEMTRAYGKGDMEAALAPAARVVELAVANYGKTDLRTARALQNRGMIESAKGDKKRAENTFEEALDIYKKHKDLDRADGARLAALLESLATIRSSDNSISAESLFKHALEWREKSNGPDSPETATALVHLANMSFWNREYKKSAELFARALVNLAKNPKAATNDITFVYYRTRCAYRKANIEDRFEPLKQAYGEKAEIHAATTPAPDQAKVIQAGVVNGKALDLPAPAYPAEARRANAAGQVNVEVLINEKGHVISACSAPDKVHPLLMEASEVAAYKAKFSPTTLDGRPVKVHGVISYNYRY